MIKVNQKDGESIDRMIKRFGSHIKSRGLLKSFRDGRYFSQSEKKRKVREAAISREKYRSEAKRKQYL
jgi:ribosomal protein S21